ncbi:MAG TPA: cupin [Alphaproteobacteria bacterium]|jgi:1,2-dihydroxy-3-keto-5-methylthiopentene dioxygenase
MSQLNIYADAEPAQATLATADAAAIARELQAIGVRFERWQAAQPVVAGASQDEIVAAYRAPIDRMMAEGGYQTVDVISLTPDHPDKVALRQKFLSEHTHSEDEIRFFVDGQGLFSLHAAGKVFAVLCEKGDLISVPAGMTHWFDMGPAPRFACIRIFGNPEGWVAKYTGSPIADGFPRIDAMVAAA